VEVCYLHLEQRLEEGPDVTTTNKTRTSQWRRPRHPWRTMNPCWRLDADVAGLIGMTSTLHLAHGGVHGLCIKSQYRLFRKGMRH
jgi:hypothetical protein